MNKYTIKLYRYVPNMSTMRKAIGDHRSVDVIVKSVKTLEHQEMFAPAVREWANHWLKDHYGEVEVFLETSDGLNHLLTVNNRVDMRIKFYDSHSHAHLIFKELDNI